MLWTEEFRPKEFKDVVGLNPSIPLAIENEDMPHLLFYGLAGCGKSSTARVIVNATGMNYLKLNASDERGIDIVRDKIKPFAMTMSTNGKSKIILLEEADALTPQAQDALKDIMEEYCENCKFILTCNKFNKITDPIKSRCQLHKFGLSKKEDILKRLKEIVTIKNFDISEDFLNQIIDKNYPDIRRCINQLQELFYISKKRSLMESDLKQNELLAEQLFEKIKTESFSNIRQWVLENNVDYEDLLVKMYEYIIKNKVVFPHAIKYLLKIKNCCRYINNCVSPEIEFEGLILELRAIK